jgi:hypothetical protein
MRTNLDYLDIMRRKSIISKKLHLINILHLNKKIWLFIFFGLNYLLKPSRRQPWRLKKRKRSRNISMNDYKAFFYVYKLISIYLLKLISFLSIKPYLFRYHLLGVPPIRLYTYKIIPFFTFFNTILFYTFNMYIQYVYLKPSRSIEPWKNTSIIKSIYLYHLR